MPIDPATLVRSLAHLTDLDPVADLASTLDLGGRCSLTSYRCSVCEVAVAGQLPGAGRRRQAGCTCQPLAVERSPRVAKRARLVAAARSFQSWATRTSPRTRARRPPWRRRSRWASLRSTLGRVAR